MGKKYRSKHGRMSAAGPLAVLNRNSSVIAALLSFFLVCIGLPDSVKGTVMFVIVLTMACGLVRFSKLRSGFTLPVLMLFLIVLMDGLSIIYAPSGKFALGEFLQVALALCFAVLLLIAAPGEGQRPGRWIAAVLAGCTALGGLISIDMISTHLISTPVLRFLGWFDNDYNLTSGLEVGIRITSMFLNPNVFAGMVGLGVLLSLGLAVSAEAHRERMCHLVCLFINALSFVLAFSMGASATIALAFLVYLILERKERRAALFLLMLKTLILTVIAAALISMTSFQAWSGFQPIPMLSTLLGAAALCASDVFLDPHIVGRLEGGKKLPILISGAVVLLVCYFLSACLITGGVTLQAGEGLRRAAYPEPGDYVLRAEVDGPAFVTVESQNQRDTMMHTSTILYQGDLSAAAFSVPEDSLVVYFNFSAGQDLHLDSVTYEGGTDSGRVPLGYKLLPGFIANRLQGLLANQNAIQRLVFFSDGMKLFRHSPIIGLGLGAFENGIMSVQSFYYVARHAHNHYVQAAVDTGLVGLLLFVGLIVVSAAAVLLDRRRADGHCLTPALGAAVVFMAGHAAVEVNFSYYSYLPIAFAVFALIGLCCRDSLPSLPSQVRTGTLAVSAALLLIFAVLLGRNLQAESVFLKNPTFSGLVEAAKLDVFEGIDYKLSYVTNAGDPDLDVEIRQQADLYAEELAELNSNIVPLYLAEYYMRTDRVERAFEMVEKYVNYVSSDSNTWQQAFNLLQRFEQDSDVYRTGVVQIARMLEDWNTENMGEITLSEDVKEFIARMSA